jgi:hypothetical protein
LPIILHFVTPSHLTVPIPPSRPAVFTSSVGPESTVAVACLAVWPMIIEATKSLNKGSKEESVPTFPWL